MTKLDAQGAGASEPAWYRRERLRVPDRVPGFRDRPDLLKKLSPTRRRLTLLKAPAGFGKTELLAEACRRLVDEGVPLAWLTASEVDDLSHFLENIAHTMRESGYDIPPSESRGSADPMVLLERIVGALESDASPCVLALDEVERWKDPALLSTLSELLVRAPPTLHLAVACRESPPALDITGLLLAGQAQVFGADELRFSKAETAELFNNRLSNERLASLVRECRGWPITLFISRNLDEGGAPRDELRLREMLGSWIEGRLWRGLSAADRDLLLDVSLFDSLNTELIDQILEQGTSLSRLRGMPQLDGIIEWHEEATTRIGEMHPLLREHCAGRLLREAPERCRTIQRRLALALDSRGKTLDAMRHAAESDDPELAGRILVDAGGLTFWLCQGAPGLEHTSSAMTGEAGSVNPRLALARCVLLVMNGRMHEAIRTYNLAKEQSQGFTVNPAGSDHALRIDHCIAVGVLWVLGGMYAKEFPSEAVAEYAKFWADDTLAPTVRATLGLCSCVYVNIQGQFDAVLDFAERTRRWSDERTMPFLTYMLELQYGSLAMARGRAEEAARHYAAGQRIAKNRIPNVPVAANLGNILMRELQLERNRLVLAAGASVRVSDTFAQPGNTVSIYAASAGMIAELNEMAGGTNAAMAAIGEMAEHARHSRLQILLPFLSALRVAVLADSGRVEEADALWRREELPSDEDCTKIAYSWREMEAFSCSRIRLHTAREDYDSGRRVIDGLLEATRERDLVRTRMRGLSLATTLEHRAGNPEAAQRHLAEFLDLYRETDYSRSLVREGKVATAELQRYLKVGSGKGSSSEHALAAKSLLEEITESSRNRMSGVPTLTKRDLEVLGRLDTQRDKDIANDLGLSVDGVRAHVRRIFARLGVRNRRTAVDRARAIGLIPTEL